MAHVLSRERKNKKMRAKKGRREVDGGELDGYHKARLLSFSHGGGGGRGPRTGSAGDRGRGQAELGTKEGFRITSRNKFVLEREGERGGEVDSLCRGGRGKEKKAEFTSGRGVEPV